MINTLRAELTKIVSLPTTVAVVAAALLAPPALALASGLAFDPSSSVSGSVSVATHGFETAGFGQPLVILLAALIAGNEYLDGSLRTTLVATPGRGRILTAKIAIVAALAALIGLIATATAVLLKHAVLGEHGLSVGEFTIEMFWNLVGVSVNYALIAVVAAAITVIARTFIVTLVVLVPLVLGLTISLVGALPALKFLPDLAGIQLLTAYPGIGLLDPILGGFVMAGWAAVLTAVSAATFLLRDVGGSS